MCTPQRIEYDGFGRILDDTNPGFQSFRFAGDLLRRSVSSGSASTTTIPRPDTGPIGFAAGINLYAYCRNDPSDFADPLCLP
ncbi:MAG: hypothetical protein GXP31_11900 [Kiritimatiellaeota bacterium]|nr:hypothetical protein [Kiritimatiellota bacterium]